VGDGATASALAIGAKAHTSGEHVVFAGTPTLETRNARGRSRGPAAAGRRPGEPDRQTGDGYEQHADAVAGAVASGRSAKALPGASRPSAARADGTGSPMSVQRKDYSDPQDADIAQVIKDAGITQFGPYVYVWDSTKTNIPPRWKLKPAGDSTSATHYKYTVADCVNQPRYDPETKLVAGEKKWAALPKQPLIDERRKAALTALFGLANSPMLAALLGANGGATHRDFVSLAAEDVITGGHTAQRHILGKGVMTEKRKVALRAAFHEVDTIKMPLDKTGPSAGTASVWKDEAAANKAIADALTAELAKNWEAHRKTLAKGSEVHIDMALPSEGVSFRKHTPPPGEPYDPTEMPKYIDGSKAGDRELYKGDFTASQTTRTRPSTARTRSQTKLGLISRRSTWTSGQQGLAGRLGHLHGVAGCLSYERRLRPLRQRRDVGRRRPRVGPAPGEPARLRRRGTPRTVQPGEQQGSRLPELREKLESFIWWADDAVQCLERVLADPPPDLGRIVRERAGVEVWVEDGGSERVGDDAAHERWLRETTGRLRAMFDEYVARKTAASGSGSAPQ
jgi:hypothetical protein